MVQGRSMDMPTTTWASTSREFFGIVTLSIIFLWAALHNTAHSTRSSFSNTRMRPFDVPPY